MNRLMQFLHASQRALYLGPASFIVKHQLVAKPDIIEKETSMRGWLNGRSVKMS